MNDNKPISQKQLWCCINPAPDVSILLHNYYILITFTEKHFVGLHKSVQKANELIYLRSFQPGRLCLVSGHIEKQQTQQFAAIYFNETRDNKIQT